MVVYNQNKSKEEIMFGEREVSADLGDNLVDIDIKEDKKKNKEIDEVVAYLEMYKDDRDALTKKYTELYNL